MRRSLILLAVLLVSCDRNKLVECKIDEDGKMPYACVGTMTLTDEYVEEPTITYGMSTSTVDTGILDCRIELIDYDKCSFRLSKDWSCILKVDGTWECSK